MLSRQYEWSRKYVQEWFSGPRIHFHLSCICIMHFFSHLLQVTSSLLSQLHAPHRYCGSHSVPKRKLRQIHVPELFTRLITVHCIMLLRKNVQRNNVLVILSENVFVGLFPMFTLAFSALVVAAIFSFRAVES